MFHVKHGLRLMNSNVSRETSGKTKLEFVFHVKHLGWRDIKICFT